MSSNNSKAERGSRKAALADQMFEKYRRNHRYSLKKQNPELYNKVLEVFEQTPMHVLEEMYSIVDKKIVTKGNVPHPNYWLTIIKALSQKPENKEKVVWGRIL